MAVAGEAEGLREAAGTGGELAGVCGALWRGWEAAVGGHLGKAEKGLKGAQKDAPGQACGLAGDVHAEVAAVDGIDIGVSGGAEEGAVARGGAAMGVGGGVGRQMVRAKVGLGFHDAASEVLRTVPVLKAVDEQFAQQARGDPLRGMVKEGARRQAAGKTPAGEAGGGGGYFWVLFHSFRMARTSSAWPSGVTLGKMCSSFWSGPMRKVVRSMPQTFLPYMFFSLSTPN